MNQTGGEPRAWVGVLGVHLRRGAAAAAAQAAAPAQRGVQLIQQLRVLLEVPLSTGQLRPVPRNNTGLVDV